MTNSKIAETLADLKEHRMGLYAHCSAPGAGHGSELDLDFLIDRFGKDFVYINETQISRALVYKKVRPPRSDDNRDFEHGIVRAESVS